MRDRLLQRLTCAACYWWLLSIAGSIGAAEPNRDQQQLPPAAKQKVDFVRDVAPILAKRCYNCHGPDAQEGQLRLDARAIVFAGGRSGPAVQSGKSAESLLVKRIAGLGDKERMPPEDDPLTAGEIGLIRAWIDQGAHWPETFGSNATRVAPHWAYRPPRRAKLPDVSDLRWPASPIDYYVLARLDREGLTPSPAAERARLLRRLHLDLIGLPPSPAEVDAFLRDESPHAYEKAVDRLLESQRYGEHWARLWLDLVRYADSNGYQADQFREIWPYRDWVIRAINRDMPFDQFTIEQIAGDLLPEATLEQKIATGMHRLTTCNVEAGVDPEENRTNQIIDRVNVTSTIWLGSSIECAQCHDHKYDPFSHRDYYQLFSFFNNTPLEVKLASGVQFNFYGPKLPLPLTGEQQAERGRLQARRAEIEQDLKQRTEQVLAGQAAWEARQLLSDAKPPTWRVLDVAQFTSSGGARGDVLADQSILVGGKNPDTDTYTLRIETPLADVTALKIETLLDDSLPGKGPGRQEAGGRANFVLSELSAALEDADGRNASPLHLTGASADYAHADFPAAAAIDGNKETGWAIHQQYHKPHHAVFEIEEPIALADGRALVLKLEQLYGAQRTIGRLRVSARSGKPSAGQLPAEVAKLLHISPEKRNKKQQKKIEEHLFSDSHAVVRLRSQRDKLAKQIDAIEPPSTLVMVEMDKPRPTHIFERGNFLNKGQPVEPGVPEVLHEFSNDAPRNRLGLAEWLVDPRNPLVGRVMVNRWWAEFFGRGLVSTVEDFGTQGERPTHPELLDWLALELVESGWSMKHVHRSIVMSSTYRQSSRMEPKLVARDPYNKLLARGPRFRLSAEMVRDNALAISGLLTARMGGPPIYPPQPSGIWRHVGRNAPKYQTSQGVDRFRRGIYVVWRRSAPYASFVNFDAPDRAASCVKRPRTNTPLQALTLLNDPAYIEMTLALARRMIEEQPTADAAQRAAYGFQLCVARRPSETERNHLAAVFERELRRLRANPQQATALLGGLKKDSDADPVELAAWFYVANILLNLDETITKG